MFGKQGGSKATPDQSPKAGGIPPAQKWPDVPATGTSTKLGNPGNGGKFPSTGNNDKNRVK